MTIYYLFYFFCAVVGLCILLLLAQLGKIKLTDVFYLLVLGFSCSVFAYIVRPPAPNEPMNAFYLASLRSSRMMNCEPARIYLNQTEHYHTLLNKDYERIVTQMRQACLNGKKQTIDKHDKLIDDTQVDDIDTSNDKL